MPETDNYEGFDIDIKTCFSDIIERYNFHFNEKARGIYNLKNNKCILTFDFDKGSINCFASDPMAMQESFHVGVIWSALCPNKEVPVHLDADQSLKSQMEFYAAVLNELNFILLGDFSWKERYKSYVEEESRKIEIVQKLDTSNPIYQKFVNGDLSWQKDLEEYITKNN
jgi:hypothetical protein